MPNLTKFNKLLFLPTTDCADPDNSWQNLTSKSCTKYLISISHQESITNLVFQSILWLYTKSTDCGRCATYFPPTDMTRNRCSALFTCDKPRPCIPTFLSRRKRLGGVLHIVYSWVALLFLGSPPFLKYIDLYEKQWLAVSVVMRDG